jgi:hypothetical protein
LVRWSRTTEDLARSVLTLLWRQKEPVRFKTILSHILPRVTEKFRLKQSTLRTYISYVLTKLTKERRIWKLRRGIYQAYPYDDFVESKLEAWVLKELDMRGEEFAEEIANDYLSKIYSQKLDNFLRSNEWIRFDEFKNEVKPYFARLPTTLNILDKLRRDLKDSLNRLEPLYDNLLRYEHPLAESVAKILKSIRECQKSVEAFRKDTKKLRFDLFDTYLTIMRNISAHMFCREEDLSRINEVLNKIFSIERQRDLKEILRDYISDIDSLWFERDTYQYYMNIKNLDYLQKAYPDKASFIQTLDKSLDSTFANQLIKTWKRVKETIERRLWL